MLGSFPEATHRGSVWQVHFFGMRIWEEVVFKEAAREVCGKCMGSVWKVQLSRLTKALEMVLVQALSRNIMEPFFSWIWPWKRKKARKKNILLLISHNGQGFYTAKKKDIPIILIPCYCHCIQLQFAGSNFAGPLPSQNLIRIRTMPGGNEAKV